MANVSEDSSFTNEDDSKRAQLQYGYTSASMEIDIEEPPPFVADLTRSNDPPPRSVLFDLENRLQQVDAFITNADRDIAHMRACIDRLEKAREKYAPLKATYKVVLHPFRRLPAEVLLEIFSQCVVSYEIVGRYYTHKAPSHVMSNTPWPLAHVCRCWRNIVLTAPRLWTTISIDFTKLGSRKDSNLISLMSHHLRFSRNLPLTVAITYTKTELHPLLSLLFSYSSRWQEVRLDLPVTGFVLLSSIVKGSLPLLRKAFLRAIPSSGELWDRVTIDAFQYAPQLKTVRARSIPAFTRNFLLPWEQIEHYEYIGSFGLVSSDVLSYLRRAVDADICVFDLVNPLSSTTLSSVQHTTLHQLQLRGRSMRSIGQLLDLITTPVLKDLTIVVTKEKIEQQEDDGRAIVHFIERSSCSLTNLRITGLSDLLTVRFLRVTPTVTWLWIDPATIDVLRALIYRKGSPCVLPRLTFLHISSGDDRPVDEHCELLLLDMLLSRTVMSFKEDIHEYPCDSDLPRRLETVSLSSDFKFETPEAQEGLAKLRSVCKVMN